MDNKIVECHQFLNNIYEDAEKMLEHIIGLSYNATINSYNNHYININGKYEEQKYFMPVISIVDKGDICFNLDGIAFEFYIVKEKLLQLKALEELLVQYGSVLNIYEFEDCTIDIYLNGDSKEELFRKVKQSKDSKFGIAIDCSSFEAKDIINHFNRICSLLEIGLIE